jgi:hypothetical protein
MFGGQYWILSGRLGVCAWSPPSFVSIVRCGLFLAVSSVLSSHLKLASECVVNSIFRVDGKRFELNCKQLHEPLKYNSKFDG